MVDIAKLGVEIDPAGATRGAAVVNRSLDKMAKKAKTTGTKMAGAFKSLKTQLFSMKGLMVGIFTGFAIREVVGKFSKFAGAIQDLAAITGATGQDLKFLSDAAREMGATTTLSAIESAEAIKLIASAKPDLLEFKEALVAVTKEAVALSEASGVLLPEAAKVLGLSLNQFGADAAEAGRFINVLAAGAKFGSSEVAETGQAIEKAGVVARLAGVSFEELNAMIQILAANGIKGAIAGTQLRGTLLSMAEEGDNASIKIHGVAGAFAYFKDIVKDSQKAVKIFGRENITAASILAQSTDALVTLTAKMSGTGIAYEQQSIRVNFLGGDVKALKSTWDELMITIGESQDDEMRSGVMGFRSLILEVILLIENIDLLGAALGQTIPIAAIRTETALAKIAANFIIAGRIIKETAGNLKVFGTPSALPLAVFEALRKSALLQEHGGVAGAFATDQKKIEEEGKRREALVRKQFADQLKVRQDLEETRRKATIATHEKDARERDRLSKLGIVPGAGGDQQNFDFSSGVYEAIKKRTEAFEEQGRILAQELLTPMEQFNIALAHYKELRVVGAISEETFARAVAESKRQLDDANKSTKEINATAIDLGQTFAGAFEEAIIQGKKFSEVLRGLAQDLARLAIRKLITDKIFAATTTFFSGFGGISAAHGADFIVGGRPGQDANSIRMNLTKGERVQVTPAGKKSTGSGNYYEITINAAGADEGSVARILELARVQIIPQAIAAARKSTIVSLQRPRFA